MTLNIRSAVKEDSGLVFALVRELAAYEKLAHEVVAAESDFAAAIEARHIDVLIAEWDGEPCGFALYFFNFSTFLGRRGIYLEDLFVHEKFRGKGIGKALLAALAKTAQDTGCGRVEWAVLNWNEPSIEFYKLLGAKPMDEWTVYRVTGEALDALAATAGNS